MVHIKDLVLDMIGDESTASLSALIRPLPSVPADMPADQILALLRERRSYQVLVTAEDGAIAGLITLEDVLTELLGGVADEFKESASQ